jgi:mono/diheme cytochrome c family protein
LKSTIRSDNDAQASAHWGDTMLKKVFRIAGAAVLAASLVATPWLGAHAADPAAPPAKEAPAPKPSRLVERGKYLVTLGGCLDCHTPGYFFGKPDFSRYLAGSDVGFLLPGLGIFVGPNLTSDKETGLGKWTRKQIVEALQTGNLPDGRQLAPIMPWRALAHLTKYDANAMAAFLQSLPPIKNQVAGPFGPSEKPTVAVMMVVAPDAYPPAPPAK